MKGWTPGLCAAFALMAVSAGAAPDDFENESRDEPLKVGSQFQLRAHPQSENLDASLQATVEEDGYRIDVAGTYRIGDPAKYYHLDINLKSRMYKATKKAIPSEWAAQQGKRLDTYAAASAIAPGTWYVELKLITEDPPQIDLATTVNYLRWSVSSTGAITILEGRRGCTAYDGTGQPYPVDTHWYTSTCTSSFVGSYPSTHRVDASYYNWDWGYDSQSTTASHVLTAQPNNNGTGNYNYSYSHAGEDSYLLQADYYVNGTQQF